VNLFKNINQLLNDIMTLWRLTTLPARAESH